MLVFVLPQTEKHHEKSIALVSTLYVVFKILNMKKMVEKLLKAFIKLLKTIEINK